MRSFIYFVLLIICGSAQAVVHCSLSGEGARVYDFSVNFDSQQNSIGYQTSWKEQTASGQYYIGGACDPKENIYYSTRVSELLTYSFSQGSGMESFNWYDIANNDYLQIASRVYMFQRNAARFVPVPVTDYQNFCNPSFCGGPATTGSRVQISLRVKRKFVGTSWINHIPIFYLYANQGGAGFGYGNPIVIAYLTAQITVPQSCEINAGEMVSFNFGSVSATDFRKAGAGARPDSIQPQLKTLKIQCKNIAAQALVTLRIESNKASGNILVSDNPDVGFIVADSQYQPLIPNNFNSRLNFELDNDASARVGISAWPVSVTGNRPAGGDFVSLAGLRVDFD